MRPVWPGRPYPRGATFDGDGVNFAVFSQVATRVEVCLFDPDDPTREIERFDLPETHRHVWHGYVPGLRARARSTACACTGPTSPSAGTAATRTSCWSTPTPRRCTARWTGRSRCSATPARADDAARPGASIERDSAAGVPKSVVVERLLRLGRRPPPETCPGARRSSTRRTCGASPCCTPTCPSELRGTYAGLAHPAVIEHLTSAGRHRGGAAARARVRRRRLPRGQARCATTGATARWASSRPSSATPAARTPGAQVARVQGDGEGAARGRHRGDPRRRLQPHLRGQPPGPDAVAQGHRQRRPTTG